MNPRVGELWKYTEPYGDRTDICVIIKAQIFKSENLYTVHWLGGQYSKYEMPLDGWRDIHFRDNGYFRKLS